MKTFILAAVSVFLFSRGLAMAQTDTTPIMRHVNYVAVSAQRGSQVKLQVANMQHGFAPYADLLKCRLVRPDGFIAASTLMPVGGKADIAAKVEWDGLCALETNSGWNLAKVQLPSDLPHAYVSKLNQPLKTVRAWGPLYFVVPKGTPYFNVFVHASVKKEGLHLTIKNPSGEVVREEDGDFDEVTKIQIVLPKGQGDGVWSVELSPPKTPGMALDDVYVELGPQLPPFLAPKPEWAKLFAADWKPEAVKPSAPAEKTPPKLEPFRGATGPEIDRAYSRDTSAGWKTSLPFTYVLDYGGKHLGNPDYIPAVSTAPPTLLHLGKDVPFNHGWGPVKALGGENQAYGHGEFIQRLTPDEVRERITGLKAMVDGLHKAGARWVTPYICAMTVNGDNERRTGFWEFYDHWDDYRPLGLCAKPAADPFQWLQRTPEGKPRIYYGYNYPAEFYPPFKTNHRLAACWRTEGWRTWLCEVVRFAARCGHDGVFVDNAGSQRCQCPRCLAAFREFLKKRFTVERARELFGDTPLDSIAFPDKPGTPLTAELNRFWCETLRDEMATLKTVGTKELGREFIVFPNGGNPGYIQSSLMDSDFVMFEKSIGDYGTNPGMALCPVFEGVQLRAYNDNILEHKFVQCLRRRVKPIILSRGGYPREVPWFVMNPNTARVGFAECGAFSGGGGFLLRPAFDVFHDALNEYRRFFETHPALFAGLDSYAQIGVLAWPEQHWYEYRAHIMTVRALTSALTEAHALFDYVPESLLDESRLRRYAAVVAPDLPYVSNAQLELLTQYVTAGGRLVLLGDFAKYNEAMKERPAPDWTNVKPSTQQRLGQGTVARCASVHEVPSALATVLGAEPSALSCPDTQRGPHVKVNAFRASDRIIVHLVNYNVALGLKSAEPEAVDGLTLTIPLPDGLKAASATSYAPDEPQAASLPVQNHIDSVSVRIPALRVYRVVEFRLSR